MAVTVERRGLELLRDTSGVVITDTSGVEIFAVGPDLTHELNIQPQHIQFESMISRRGVARFRTYRPPGVHHVDLDVGDEVYIKDGAVTVWGGTVEEYTETEPVAGSQTPLFFSYTAIDFDEYATRRLLAASYVDMTAGAIVQDIITDLLAGFGVTAGVIQDGPTIGKIVFNYMRADQAIDELAELAGFTWSIDETKALNFRERSSVLSPWNLSASSRPYTDIQIQRSRYRYRNQQTIRGGFDLTDSRTETMDGDGETRSFVLGFPAGVVSLVETNTGSGFAARTVGILGVDTGRDWYYSVGSNVFVQDSGGTALSSGHTLRVTYQGQVPVLVQALADEEKVARAASEGGIGIYEDIHDDPAIASMEQAESVAASLLTRFGQIHEQVVFRTFTSGLRGGQLIGITLPDHGLSGSYLIETVRATGRDDAELVYTVTALSGDTLGGWERFFRSLINAGRTLVVRENEVLVILRVVRDTVTITESVAATTVTASGFTVGTGAYIGAIDVG